jgi:FAD dependent oxidoreductase
VVTAVQVARMGKSVVLIEPGRAIGGMTSGGLGNTDIGKQASIGGKLREQLLKDGQILVPGK